QSLANERVEPARICSKLGELACKRGRGDEGNARPEKGLRLLALWVPGSNALRALGAVWARAVQAGHTLLPQLWLARRPLENSEEDLLAVHLYSRLAYGYWYHRGRMAVLWAHLRELNIAERYPPTPELAQAYSEHSPVATVLPW